MPSAAKSGVSSKAPADPVAFEEALKKLESIVESMEAGDLPLDRMLSQYEEGVRLAQVCQSRLAEAELKIEQLEKNALGEASLRPVAADSPENE